MTIPEGLRISQVIKLYVEAEYQRLGCNKSQLAWSLGVPIKTVRNWFNGGRWPYVKNHNPLKVFR